MEDNQEGEKLKNGLIYGLNDKPPFKEAFFAALQHLLAIFIIRKSKCSRVSK